MRDYPTFALTWGSPAFLCTILGYGTVAFMAYSASYWGAPYAERTFAAISKSELGFFLGGGGAVGGFLGVILGGRMADALLQRTPSGRVWVIPVWLAKAPFPLLFMQYTTTSWTLFILLNYGCWGSRSIGSRGRLQQLASLWFCQRMRGTATATFFLATYAGRSGVGALSGRLCVSEKRRRPIDRGSDYLVDHAGRFLHCSWPPIRLVPKAAATIVERAQSGRRGTRLIDLSRESIGAVIRQNV